VRKYLRAKYSKCSTLRWAIMIPLALIFLKDFAEYFMALTLDDVKRVAHLARIAINDEEAQSTHAQLSGIFTLIAQMEAVDVSNIEPMSHAQDVVQRLRDDAVTEADQRDSFQAVAPQVDAGLYLVPKVIA
jgi:aspartyl-tRNA(Asn)/glutamyl-tRNA(Gln) amidotransferase subunit C